MSTSFAVHLPIVSRRPAWSSQLLSPFSALLLSDLFLNKVPSLLHWCFSPHCPCDATKTKSSLCCCSYDILVTESWLSCIHCFFYIPLFVPRFQHLSHTHRQSFSIITFHAWVVLNSSTIDFSGNCSFVPDHGIDHYKVLNINLTWGQTMIENKERHHDIFIIYL